MLSLRFKWCSSRDYSDGGCLHHWYLYLVHLCAGHHHLLLQKISNTNQTAKERVRISACLAKFLAIMCVSSATHSSKTFR